MERVSSWTKRITQYVGCKYQIRAKRVACGRLVTVQTFDKNKCVLLVEGVVFTTALEVNDVFNFCCLINVKR
jgi:hypothetical protein